MNLDRVFQSEPQTHGLGWVMNKTMESATAFKRNAIQMGLLDAAVCPRAREGRLMPAGCRAPNAARRALPQRQSD
jgi:hypothetical protein